MTSLDQQLASLSPDQRRLVELWMRTEAQAEPPPPARIPRRPETDLCPLTFAQQQLWFLYQWEPTSTAYNFPIAVRISGSCDVATLERSLNAIVERHEVLRTSFSDVQGQPQQVVAPALRLPLRRVELDHLPVAVRQAQVEHLALAEARSPFDLQRGPLLRVSILRLAASEHILLIIIHHIVFDGWSRGVLVRELLALYSAFRAQRAAPLPPLPLQYADYATWQRQQLPGSGLDAQLVFWTEQLRHAPPLLDLPTDHPRSPLRTVRGASQLFAVPARLIQRLKALSQQAGATLFMTLLAAFDVLAARYSGQDDIVVGTPIAGRTQAELEGLIGLFVNMLALRTDLTGNPSFRELLQRVRAVALAAYAHQDISFEQLLETLAIGRDTSRHPIFQVMLALQNAPMPAAQSAGLTVEPIEIERTTARYDLALFFREEAEGLRGRAEYSTDLFTPATIQRMCGQFCTLLEGIVADPTQRLSALPLLSAAEREQLLVGWNATQAAYPQECTLHELAQLQAARTPDAVAVILGNQHLSYAALDRRATQLAHYLRARGVGPDRLVGVSMARSVELVVALLGVFKAGAAYVPLDPAYPRERIAFMLEDSQAPVLITASAERESGRRGEGESSVLPFSPSPLLPFSRNVVDLRADWAEIARQPTQALPSDATPDHLAYVIYTSGSTGTPKGVLGLHRGAVNRFAWMWRRYPFAPTERGCQKTSLNFLDSLWELFGPLLQGIPTLILPDKLVTDPPRLVAALAAQQVTRIVLVPSLLRLMLESSPDLAELLPKLWLWVSSGEALSPELCRLFQTCLPGRMLLNLYGSSELSADVAWHETSEPTGASPVPIGRPLANMQLYVLDARLQVAPIGVPGELYAGGVGLARGYHRRPDLTAERFVPNPFGTMNDEDRTMNEPDSSFIVHRSSFGERLYRTGDLARFLADGSIEYLGRVDQQVKLRGFRIELGEVETILREHPSLREAVVVLREDRLVAYVVPASDERRTTNDERPITADDRRLTIDDGVRSELSSIVNRPSSLIDELRGFLKGRLPDYMLPSAFVVLDALPLTPSGKVNRRALPAPDLRAAQPRFLAPRTPEEQLLAEIWADVLRIAQVGLDDNFFELGGHSLLATRVVARLRTEFQIELPLRSLFEMPTLAALAERIAQERRRGSALSLTPLTPQPRVGAVPLSFAQERLWFLDQFAPGSASYNIPLALRLFGALELQALAQAFQLMHSRHEVLRTTFHVSDGLPLQLITPPHRIRLPLLDLAGLPAEARTALSQMLARQDARQPFDLGRGPLWRVALLRLSATDHALLLNLHHTIADGWSLDVLTRELAACYTASVRGQAVALPPLPIQYADYALWQRSWLQGAELEAQLAYWRAQLADAPPVVELPTDHPRPAVQSFAGASVPLRFEAELVRQLRVLSQRLGATLFMTVLAAFDVLLSRYTGQHELLVGTPIAGRQQQALEGLIGLFVNTLALRASTRGNPRFSALLEQVREACLGAYAHQELPFEKLVEALNVPRALSYPPLVQVLFALQNVPRSALRFGEVVVQPLALASTVSKFELSVVLNERADGLSGVIEYNTDLFEATTIRRMGEHLRALLTGIAADATQYIGALALMSAAERRQLLIEWNDTAGLRSEKSGVRSWESEASLLTPDPWLLNSDHCIHQLVAAQAERTPDAIALIFDPGSTKDERRTTNGSVSSSIVHRPSSSIQHLTYGELNRRANQLAQHLQALGVGPEVLVAICLERSIELMIGLLGILKAGGAYLPLDPSYPAERLRFMLDDSQAPVLVTKDERRRTNDQIDLLVSLSPCLLVNLAADWPAIAQAPATPPPCDVRASNLAYVIYTSGSTGRPKGVMVMHRGVVNILEALRRTSGLSTADRLLAVTTLAFDIAGLELYLPLIVGAGVFVASRDTASDGRRLAETLAAQRATALQATPATWRLLLAADWPGQPGLTLLCGGEALAGSLAHALDAHGRALWNLYGPTETTIWSSAYRVPPANSATAPQALVPIGRPIANTQLYVLDDRLEPVPLGVAGELYIGGTGQARGYLGRPDLTAERFIPNPFVNCRLQIADCRLEDSSICNLQSAIYNRLYRTGDLVRYRRDGTLEFLGRLDHQVKLRGFRIELGEIESALAQHATVQEAVVLAREDAPGDQRLIAYVVPMDDDRRLTIDDGRDSELSSIVHRPSSLANELRGFLAERLPDYMIPSAFVVLDTLPLTPNGKLDRRALPSPDVQERRGAFVAPRNSLEERLAGIWTDVLKRERIDVHDSFFDLGGHSLLATRLIAQIRNVFQIDIPLRLLFEAPTVADLAEVVAERMGKRAEYAGSTARLPAIAPDPSQRNERFPLTDIQQAYWIGRSGAFELGNVSTHSYMELDMVGLDLERFGQVCQRLIDRHEMLRAIILPNGLQQILTQVPPYQIATLDLRGHEPASAATQLAEVREQMSHQVLPSDRWPLFDIRASLLDEERIRLHIGSEALIIDARSRQVIIHELAQLYQNPETPLPPLDLSFRDYVLAEADVGATELYQRSQDYWWQRLPTLPPAPELPLAKSPDALRRQRFVRRSARLEPEVWERLKRQASRAGLTPSAVLMAAFAEVLAVWSKQPRFTINLTLFNRLPLHPQVDDIVGDFTSLTLLAVEHAPASFEVRARRLQQQLWDDLDHRYISGVRVIRELTRRQGGRLRALMPVVFTSTLVQQTGERRPALQAMLGEVVYSVGQTPQVWLDHQVAERDGMLAFSWDAVEELFPTGLLDDMFAAYCGLLQRLADEETCWRATTLDLVPPAQRARLAALNATEETIPAELLHTLFDSQVPRRSAQAAVIGDDRILTYAELSQRANQVGRRLRRLGARPNTLVAVVMEKGWEQVVAVLGVLAAGAAYLPIDPGLPKERLHLLLEQGEVALALTQPWVDERLDWPVGIKRIRIEGDALVDEDDHPLTPVQRAEDLAYVIFTSGSTGSPKGVMIDHRGAVNTIVDINQRFGVGPEDRVLALSALNFDLSVYDIFGVLAAGGTIVFPPAAANRDPAAWLELLEREQVTIWDTVPALMQMLVAHLDNRHARLPASLRLVMLSGDWIPVSLPDQIRALSADVAVVSLGGATEASIWSILYPITAVEPGWTSIPYGKPMTNQQFYVLNAAMQLCPVWVPGQLYIGGIGLARGYLYRADLTAERFVPNPFGDCRLQIADCRLEQSAICNLQSAIGTRLYKTGDLGRYLPDGNIEFLGREDFQVKVQGYRIELGEIEATLRQHPAVQAAVIGTDRDGPGDKRLVAYIVPTNDERRTTNDERPITEDRRLKIEDSDVVTSAALSSILYPLSSELRSFLKERLPDYMVPSAFVMLAALPLTPTGKIDRRALPAPDRQETAAAEFVAPRTPTEAALAEVWAELLNLERVGIYDNFFELGGHSLLATRVVGRVRQQYDVELPLRNVFATPTVAELAAQISGTHIDAAPALLPLTPTPRTTPLPLSFAQERLWFLDQLVPNSPLYNIPSALRLAGTLDLAALRSSFQAVVARHESLRTTFAAHDGQPSQRIAATLCLSWPLFDLAAVPIERQEPVARRLLRSAAVAPFNLARGPLVRALLVRLTPTDHLLLFSMHHIVSDGWSMGVLVRELATHYAASAAGQPAALPDLPIQYADFTLWQRAWLQGEVLDSQLAFWRRQLAGLATLQLPTDRPRPPFQTFRGRQHPFFIPAPLRDSLVALSRREGATLFMTLLAAFQALLARYTAQTDIPVGSPIANRTRPELEGLIGFFVNTLVLRGDLSGNPSFTELARRVRTTTLDAYAHQDLPFEQLVETLQVVRDPSRNPLFQVMFVLQNAPMAPLQLPSLRFEPISVATQTAKFDLWLGLSERNDGLAGALEHNTDLFDPATILRLRSQFLTLLEGIAADSTRQLAELPLLRPSERQQLLLEWNDTRSEVRSQKSGVRSSESEARLQTSDSWLLNTDGCVHTRFEQQAVRSPDAVALAFGSAQLSYAALNACANQLAHALAGLGIGLGARVAICTLRGLEPIVGLLAILKASAAYVPIDPAAPAERRLWMLAASQSSALLTQTALHAEFERAAVPTICLDTDWVRALGVESATGNLHLEISAQQLLYVIYTSGSTGLPKGVAMSHRALLNLLDWQLAYLGQDASTRFVQFASLAFDVSYQEIFPTLASGGTVVLIDEEQRRDARALGRELAAQRVERIYLPYIGLQQLAEAGAEGLLLGELRDVIVSGEQLQLTPAIERLFEGLAGRALHNFYGPSESHAVSSYRVAGAVAAWPRRMPIGRAIANTQLHVLDARLEVVPIGVIGELYIGGACLADGYLGRPDLTAERFVPDPFAEVSGIGYRVLGAKPSETRYPTPDTRLYRTGDLARWRAEGALEFLGRRDGQVKVRGYRVELGEIEAVLGQHGEVGECVVLLREDIPGDPRLVAYVVTSEESQVTSSQASSLVTRHSSLVAELRAFLKERLPEYMVPSALVLLDALPLTINGKVDRPALPAPDRSGDVGGYVAPRTPVEQVVAGIWASILGLERVGVHSNFFDLGGHSLKAVRVLTRIREIFRIELPLRRLFEATTVAALAEAIIAHERTPGQSEKIAQLVKRIKAMPATERRAPLEQKSSTE